jgi:hypothetical protein
MQRRSRISADIISWTFVNTGDQTCSVYIYIIPTRSAEQNANQFRDYTGSIPAILNAAL